MCPSTPRKKFSASISRTSDAALVAAVLFGAMPALAAEDAYYTLVYDYEVASFCGLIGKNVHDAFWAKRRALEAAADRPADILTRVRIRAMADADREYQNRGLGGYKPWCQGEGMAGIGRILE